MSIQSAVGFSKKDDAFAAGAEACAQAFERVGGGADLVMVFSSVRLAQKKMLEGVRSVSRNAPLIGCSDSGEIVTEGPRSGGVAVMALKSDQIKFVTGIGKGIKSDSRKTGSCVAQDVLEKAGKKPSLFIMLPDGLNGNGAEIVRGVQDVLGQRFPIMGGSAGDDFAFKKTYQYFDGEVLTDAVAGVGFFGKFSFGVGVKHGWEPIGLPKKVTRSRGAVLESLDNEPALKIYEDAFGKSAEELTKEPIARMAYTYPLGMSVEGSDELLIRDVVIADKEGKITCAAEIPEGAEIRLMLGDKEKAIQAACEAAKNSLAQLKGTQPKIIFVFNCMARHKLLGPRIGDEIFAIQEVLGLDVPLIGFYTYGEQAPLGGQLDPSKCYSCFHNETMALVAIGE
ncbi:MAG: FIST N-terminal domain-containing protein [Candidatus Margulisiibacteriota bacterium]